MDYQEDPTIRLETRMTYLEALVQDLSELLYTRQMQVDKLEQHVRELKAQMKEIRDGGPHQFPADKAPPHY